MIQIIIFDDKKSFIHLALGFISALLPFPIKLFLFFGFLMYELIETIISRLRGFLFSQPIFDDFLSDLLEFLVGAGLASLFKIF